MGSLPPNSTWPVALFEPLGSFKLSARFHPASLDCQALSCKFRVDEHVFQNASSPVSTLSLSLCMFSSLLSFSSLSALPLFKSLLVVLGASIRLILIQLDI